MSQLLQLQSILVTSSQGLTQKPYHTTDLMQDIYWERVQNDCLQVRMETATDQVVMVGLGVEKVGMMHVPREIWRE